MSASGRGADATPSVALPEGAGRGLPDAPAPLEIGPQRFAWGKRTFVMGIINVTPDSFSGDGLLTRAHGLETADPVRRAVKIGRAMAQAGADILDVGGESSRPGHESVATVEEVRRVAPVIAALHDELPEMPLSVDTTKPAVAEAALAAGAHLVNDVWGVATDDALARVAAASDAPVVLMHNRAEARYTNLIAEVVADLEAAIERAMRAGVSWDKLIVDPGFGFGKTAEHNLALLRDLDAIRLLGRPVLIGTSRKSTLGKVLDLPAEERLEATLATTALAIAAGVDIVRVHDVLPNVRAARMSDAIIRGSWRPPAPSEGGSP
jgi:dihydropteroate synthase